MKRYLIIYDYEDPETGWIVAEVSEAPKLDSYQAALDEKAKLEAGE